VALCRKKFAFLFDLAANERGFLNGVLDRGEIDADLLDIAPEIRARIGAMPMLAWKSRHVRKHQGLDNCNCSLPPAGRAHIGSWNGAEAHDVRFFLSWGSGCDS
jgi:hypothetical protein